MALRRSKDLDAAGLEAYALRLLGGRALSQDELRDKLTRRAARREDADALLTKLTEYGYVNDQKFAELYANWRKDREKFGRTRVLRDLGNRRVPRKVAEEAVAQVYENTDEEKLIEQFLERKFRRQPLAELLRDPKRLASTYRRLRYAGFSSAASIRVLKRFSSLADDLEGMEPPDSNESEANEPFGDE